MKAFTMAEILLSLTIIGVVAAITLPSLTGNINERTWNTQRKALYARFSQAMALMPALNGYGSLVEGNDSISAQDTAAETFVTNVLAKVLKINNICDNNHLKDCGIVTSLTTMAGSKISTPQTLYELNPYFQSINVYGASYSAINTKSVAFETQNGESIVTFYNPACRTAYANSGRTHWQEDFGFPHVNMCVNFIYDLNGNKGPNTVGKDIGIITAFNSADPKVVAPMPSPSNSTAQTWDNAAKECSKDTEKRLPNIDELSAMLINKSIIGLNETSYWSSTTYNSTHAWAGGANSGLSDVYTRPMQGYDCRFLTNKTSRRAIRCIER